LLEFESPLARLLQHLLRLAASEKCHPVSGCYPGIEELQCRGEFAATRGTGDDIHTARSEPANTIVQGLDSAVHVHPTNLERTSGRNVQDLVLQTKPFDRESDAADLSLASAVPVHASADIALVFEQEVI